MADKVKLQNISASAPRSAARLAAVQALYQMDVAQTDLKNVIEEFSAARLKRELKEGDILRLIDDSYFQSLLKGILSEQREIDPIINDRLAEGWNLLRIDSIIRAILRSSVYELLHRKDVPAKVVINEYLDISHAFFESDETRMINGVLDQIARSVRADEFNAPDVKA